MLVCGSETDGVSSQAAAVDGVSSVLQAADACLDHGVAENATALLEAAQAAHSFTHIVACATNEGKNIIPRLAAKLDIAALTVRGPADPADPADPLEEPKPRSLHGHLAVRRSPRPSTFDPSTRASHCELSFFSPRESSRALTAASPLPPPP